ncbi:TadE/TadG family type IV pilus assembly protein [Erythrobacter sp. GH1-10]|uniref:TadE/TadG family type IV pilus assembly protein n=1 Tax=Erythrobacter sp. GH1-10 TaxID=3349334 RepID=UPI003877954C
MTTLAIRFAKDRSGNAGAEMALMLPLMLTVMFATFEAGHYFYNEQKIIEAVRNGARYAGRLPFSAYSCPSTMIGTTVNQIKTVTRTGKPDGTTPLIRDWTDGDIDVTVTCNSATTTGIYAGNSGGAPIVTVSATATYNSLFARALTGSSATQVRASAQSTVNGI